MTIKDYIRVNRMTIEEFATVVAGVSRQAVHRWLNGTRIPGAKTARRIYVNTNGQVNLDSMWNTMEYKEMIDIL